jgi:hypothetical protein
MTLATFGREAQALVASANSRPTDGLASQIELEGSWREPARALDALLERRIGGKAVLHVD